MRTDGGGAMSARRRLAAAALAVSAASMLACAPARAASAYPDHAITMVVPFAAGGYTDVVARLLADKMGQSLKQGVVVDNRPGAGSTIAPKFVAHARNDGYSI